uniref:Uncharacterized protein n=1 Tax=Arundo donax TaxID=35708 RepID=A0A0A9G9V2_ARUDO
MDLWVKPNMILMSTTVDPILVQVTCKTFLI